MSVVEKHISRFNWKDKKLLLACSGGIDSVALFHTLKHLNIPFAVLHVNYQLRESQSDADEKFVKTLCDQNGIPCRTFKCPTELTTSKGKNLQNEARNFRHTLFKQWTAISEKHFVVLAHHQDDQIETFLLQYFRGSGNYGLAGMHEERNQIIRPFLNLNKSEIKASAEEHQLVWREDQSNISNKYLRNLFRNELIPQLEQTVPHFKESILLFQTQLRLENQRLENELKPQIELMYSKSAFTFTEWNTLTDVGQLFFLKELNLEPWVKNRISELLKLELSAEFFTEYYHFFRGINTIYFRPKQSIEKTWEYKILESISEEESKSVLNCSSEILNQHLSVRNLNPKDKIQLKGMTGRKLIWDILKAAGIPKQLRTEVPVLECNGKIIWVPEYAISGNPFVKNTDSSTVYISLIEKAK